MVESPEWWITPEWRRIRRECLARDGYKCRRCGAHFPRGKNLTAHHIVPRDQGGGDHQENLITLCSSCHNTVEGRGFRSAVEIEGCSASGSGEEWPEKPWYPLVYGAGRVDSIALINQVCYLLDENERLADDLDKMGAQIDRLKDSTEALETELERLEAEMEGQPESTCRPRKLTDEEGEIAARVLALYGQPGFETWAKIGKALRLARGSAYSLAHGLRKPDERTLEYLECAEWRLNHLGEATDNLKALIGDEPILPVSYTRPQAAKLERREQ